MCPMLLLYNLYRTDEHQDSMLQRPEGAGEHILLQSQIKTSYWTDALQHPTMSCQVRHALSYVSVASNGNALSHLVLS